jgi:hypothetical protein
MGNRMLAALVAACAACGGGSGSPGSGSATVTGTVAGQSMTPRDAVSNILQSNSNSIGGILITNAANTCAMLNAHQQPKNAQALLISIGRQTAAGAITAPDGTGVYTVYSSSAATSVVGRLAVVIYASTDASCNPTQDVESVSGTVTLTRIDSSGFSGSFDVTFESSGGHITGNFDTAACGALSTSIGGSCA